MKGYENNIFYKLINKAGISFKDNGERIVFDSNLTFFRHEFKKVLYSNPSYPQPLLNTICENFSEFIQDPVLFKACLIPYSKNDSKENLQHDFGLMNESLIKSFLGIDELQSPIIKILLEKLVDYTSEEDIIKSDLNDNIPKLIMNQLRWMDNIVDPDELNESLFEMISITPIHIQKEIIEAIPDIVIDSQHNDIVRKLKDIMENDTDLVVPILDTLSNLKFSESLMDELKNTVIKHLENCELEKIPILIRFLLQSIEDNDKARFIITKIRSKLKFNIISSLLKVEDIKNDDNNNISKSFGKLLFECFKNELRSKKNLCEEWLKLINELNKKEDFKSLDIDILFIIHSMNINYKKRVETIFKKKIKEDLLTPELIKDSIVLHKSGIIDYYSSIITISEIILNDSNPNSYQLAISIYYNSFASFDTYYRQEIIGSLVTHIGTGLSVSVERSLKILKKIVNSYPTEVIQFIVFIKNILDYLDNLNINQIRILFDILSTLAVKSKDTENLNNSSESSLFTDLNIIIRKQLSNPTYRYKIMGIIMGLSLICKLSSNDNSKNDENQIKNNIKLSCGLLRMIEIQCRKSLPCLQYIYDELSYLISNNFICNTLEEWIQENFACNFQNIFLLDVEDLNRVVSKEFYYDKEIFDDVDDTTDKGKQPVTNSIKFESWNNLDGEESTIVLKILPILLNTTNSHIASESKDIIICMCSMFRLLQACEKSLNNNNLDSIDALLGCGVLLFEESKNDYSPELKYQLCNSLFYSINWYRELLNAFCDQEDNEMKEKCIIRLKNIIDMENKLNDMLGSMNNIKFNPIGLYETVLINEINNNNESFYLDEEKFHYHVKKGLNSIEDLKPFMREIDISIFEILKYDLLYIEKDNVSEKQKIINYSIFKYLLNDLNDKIKQKIELNKDSNISNNKKSNKEYSNTNSLIKRISLNKFLSAISQIIPYLCKYLEDLLKLIEDTKDSKNDSSEQESLCNECFYIIIENLNYIFSSKAFIDEKYVNIKKSIFLGILKLTGDNDPNDEFQTITKIFKYFVNFKNKIESPQIYGIYIKLLDSILALIPSNIDQTKLQQLNNVLIDIIKSVLKKKITIKSSEKNEYIIYLLQLCIKKSNNPVDIMRYYCIDILPKFIKAILNSDSEVPDELLNNPLLNTETFNTYYRIMLIELNNILQNGLFIRPSVSHTLNQLIDIVDCFSHLTRIVKMYDKRTVLKNLLKQGKLFLDTFVKKAMPLLNDNFKQYYDDVVDILKVLQQSTRVFQSICNDSKIMKDLVLTTHVPQAKKILESLIFEVKIMLSNNECIGAFWIGNLRHRNIAGKFVSSQFVQEHNEVKVNIDDIDAVLNNDESIDGLLGLNNDTTTKKESKKKKNKNKHNKNKNEKPKSKEIVEDEDSDEVELENNNSNSNNNNINNNNNNNSNDNDADDKDIEIKKDIKHNGSDVNDNNGNDDDDDNETIKKIKSEQNEVTITSSQSNINNTYNKNSKSQSKSNSSISQHTSPKSDKSNLNSGEIINGRSLDMEVSPISPIKPIQNKKKRKRIIDDDDDDDNDNGNNNVNNNIVISDDIIDIDLDETVINKINTSVNQNNKVRKNKLKKNSKVIENDNDEIDKTKKTKRKNKTKNFIEINEEEDEGENEEDENDIDNEKKEEEEEEKEEEEEEKEEEEEEINIKKPKRKRRKKTSEKKSSKSKHSIYLLSQASIEGEEDDIDEIEEDLDNYDVNDSFINDDTIYE